MFSGEETKETLMKLNEAVQQVIGSYERYFNCFDVIRKKNIELCFKSTGQKIGFLEHPAEVEIWWPDPDTISEEFLQDCLDEMRKGDIEECEKLQACQEQGEELIPFVPTNNDSSS